ncbi:hypothetical protein DRN74_03665 [Candidatus Micrarchaeota archaeon]|nr:MAG: hypothetical protein DRN74_03665 [Candidatus Micrarchaeota archaeon]
MKMLSLISGGIDSPVAAYLMMRRGHEIRAVHAFNLTSQSKQMLSKIKVLGKKLSEYQKPFLLYLLPFGDIQKEIIKCIKPRFRMIIYRRFMFRICNEIGNADAVITGDSLGQVASQTLANLKCIYEASKLPVVSPLISMNKQEVIDIAKRIGTYNISILPYTDCCSFMIAKHPETHASLEDIKEAESRVDNANDLVRAAVKKAEQIRF